MKDNLFEYRSPETSGSVVREDTYVAHIPKGIGKKHALLRTISELLRFPPYFGFNWDALEECLADLSWLGRSSAWLWHEDLPLLESRDETRNYLIVLTSVLEGPSKVQLRIGFPQNTKDQIAILCAESRK
jgi:Barstar (barnase inhibitor)